MSKPTKPSPHRMIVNISKKRARKCARRGCKEKPIFEWQLCACGDFSLCEAHDLLLNHELLRALDKRPLRKIMQRYMANERRVRIVRDSMARPESA